MPDAPSVTGIEGSSSDQWHHESSHHPQRLPLSANPGGHAHRGAQVLPHAAKKEDFAATWKVTAHFDGLHPKLVESLEGEVRQSWELFATGWDFEILEEKVSGDCAVVVVNEVRKEGSRGGIDPDPAYLIKQDGEWRVFPDPSGREAAQQLAKQHAATYEKLEKWFKDRKVALKKKLEK